MAKRAKASASSGRERELGLVSVDEPVIDQPPAAEAKPELPPPPPRVPPTAPSRTSPGPSFGKRVGRFFRFLLRLVLLLIIMVAIVAGLYYGLPLLYQQYVLPVEQNTTGMRELQSQQEQIEQQLADLQTKLQTNETVQNQHDQSLNELDQRVNEIGTESAARTGSLAALEEMQSELQAQNEATTLELERQISLLKSMELLSRARLSMYQSNFGLARQDVQIARELLVTIQPDAPGSLEDELEEVIQRLDMTLSNLPNFPVAASDDLDIAWQILLSGLPEATPTATVTPTQAGSASPTPGTATVTLTPTPPATARPSATP